MASLPAATRRLWDWLQPWAEHHPTCAWKWLRMIEHRTAMELGSSRHTLKTLHGGLRKLLTLRAADEGIAALDELWTWTDPALDPAALGLRLRIRATQPSERTMLLGATVAGVPNELTWKECTLLVQMRADGMTATELRTILTLRDKAKGEVTGYATTAGNTR